MGAEDCRCAFGCRKLKGKRAGGEEAPGNDGEVRSVLAVYLLLVGGCVKGTRGGLVGIIELDLWDDLRR